MKNENIIAKMPIIHLKISVKNIFTMKVFLNEQIFFYKIKRIFPGLTQLFEMFNKTVYL